MNFVTSIKHQNHIVMKSKFNLKNVKLLLVLLFGVVINGFSQEDSYRVITREGANTVVLKEGKGKLILNVRANQIVDITFVAPNGKIAKLKSSGDDGSTSGSSCPCGTVCWEDQAQQMSICTCKSCGGGGGGIRTSEHILLAKQTN